MLEKYMSKHFLSCRIRKRFLCACISWIFPVSILTHQRAEHLLEVNFSKLHQHSKAYRTWELLCAFRVGFCSVSNTRAYIIKSFIIMSIYIYISVYIILHCIILNNISVLITQIITRLLSFKPLFILFLTVCLVDEQVL